LLEFVVTDPSRQHWDKPPGDEGNYVVAGAATTTTASAFTLRSGALSPVPQTPPGVLLVSDLDGTMIGKHDQETARLKRWWEREQVPRGGVLCFSSGRSLASIRRLLDEDKRGVLAHPDVVVGAVGTRVYWHERATPAAGGGRAGFPTTNSNGKSGHGHGGGFVEDAQWLAELSSGGWDAPAAREAAYAALARAGKEAMHFLPPEDQSELKVSCGVRDGALARVLEDLQSGLAKHGATSLQGAQIIVSGHGGWRYVDVVPSRAGKLAALEHVRLSGGFAPDCTVAAGDSGNDVAMLAGKKNLAVVVGNAQPDARAWAEEQQAREREEGGLAVGAAVAVASGNGNGNGARPRQKDRLYRATGHEAAGILEALEYWGLKEKGEEDG
jgi:hydroxymethylpyrimidine pyrophosphatase-like HAD family hydrolase